MSWSTPYYLHNLAYELKNGMPLSKNALGNAKSTNDVILNETGHAALMVGLRAATSTNFLWHSVTSRIYMRPRDGGLIGPIR